MARPPTEPDWQGSGESPPPPRGQCESLCYVLGAEEIGLPVDAVARCGRAAHDDDSHHAVVAGVVYRSPVTATLKWRDKPAGG